MNPPPQMIHPPDRLESSRLLIRRYENNDAARVFAYASNPDVTRFMDWPTHKHLSESEQFVRRRDQYAWAVTKKENQELIGGIACSHPTHRCSFGYVFHQDNWGDGYATEASKALLNWLESIPDLKRIWATCDIENPGSARVLEKLGLEREGVLRNWSIRPNLPGSPSRDSFCYSKALD